jgi:hypothetical protein
MAAVSMYRAMRTALDGDPATAGERERYRDAARQLGRLGLAAAGDGAEAGSVAGRPLPLRRDRMWLFLTGARPARHRRR